MNFFITQVMPIPYGKRYDIDTERNVAIITNVVKIGKIG